MDIVDNYFIATNIYCLYLIYRHILNFLMII